MNIIIALKMILWGASGRDISSKLRGLEQKMKTERRLQKLKKPQFDSVIKKRVNL